MHGICGQVIFAPPDVDFEEIDCPAQLPISGSNGSLALPIPAFLKVIFELRGNRVIQMADSDLVIRHDA